jgi:hypothetical protein
MLVRPLAERWRRGVVHDSFAANKNPMLYTCRLPYMRVNADEHQKGGFQLSLC